VAQYIKCGACHAPANCEAQGQCLAAWAVAQQYPARKALAVDPQERANPLVFSSAKHTKSLTPTAKPVSIQSSQPKTGQRRRKDPNMTPAEQLKDDWEFAMSQPEEFQRPNGAFAVTQVIRYVAALNPDVTKKFFVGVMTELGVNPNTAAIQFAASRKETLTLGEHRLLPDGRLEDVV
jgi:hypothetical protein